MPVQGGIRERVEAAGGVYECHDISPTVETAMRDAGATFRTKEDLQEQVGTYDVVFLSSVVHEILGERNGNSLKELELIRQLVAPSGVLVIRDWSGARFQVEEFSNLKSLHVVSVDAMREVLTWVGALAINKIIYFMGGNNYSMNWDNGETAPLNADTTSGTKATSSTSSASTTSTACPGRPRPYSSCAALSSRGTNTATLIQ